MELLLLTSSFDDYDLGDIVDIRPDGHAWGTEELANALFLLVGVDDATMGGNASAARSIYISTIPHPLADPDDADAPVSLKERQWRMVSYDLIEKVATGEVIDEYIRKANIGYAYS